MKPPARRSGRSSVLRGVLGLLIPLLPACGGGAGDSAARAAEADSILRAITATPVTEPGSQQPLSGSPRLSPQERVGQPLDLSSLGFNDGSPNAPLKVLELSDFGCGYCRRFHIETYSQLRDIYISTGLLEWKYIPVSIGFPNGFQAAVAGECAGEQERFPPMRTRLFTEQARWRAIQDPMPFFADLAREEGLDPERFKACVQGGWRDARVQDNQRLRAELGVRGTPTFVLEGQLLVGAQPLEVFRDLLDAALRARGIEPPRR